MCLLNMVENLGGGGNVFDSLGY